MFLYNIKLNGKKLIKIIFTIILIVILIIFCIGIYNIFFKDSENTNSSSAEDKNIITLDDAIKADDVFEITEDNYTDILQTVTDDVDSYIGCKIHFTGYVYRLVDFDETEFVLARDMIVDKNKSGTLVVGFLCTYDKANEFADDTWVDITGTITKGNYHGDIAEIEVHNMEKCEVPENKFVDPPDDTYIPTSSML